MSLTVKLSITILVIISAMLALFVMTINKPSDSSTVKILDETEKEIQAPPIATSPIIEQVSVSAAGAYTIDGRELYSFRADKRWPIASITKLMTALVAYESFELDERVTITEEAVATEGISGGLSAGERFTVDDLVEAMILVSSNDAAEAIAIHYGRSDFISAMNQKAVEIGMTNTSFTDSTGLSVQDLSSADDLQKLAKYIWENEPRIFKISTRETGSIIDIKSGSRRQLKNINIFAGDSNFLGGKTGRIPEAEGNLLSIFYSPERQTEIIIVVLGTENRFEETKNILTKLNEI